MVFQGFESSGVCLYMFCQVSSQGTNASKTKKRYRSEPRLYCAVLRGETGLSCRDLPNQVEPDHRRAAQSPPTTRGFPGKIASVTGS